MVEQEHKGLSASDPLDTLIVGGGPAGTAAAFRTIELNHSALVIDRDIVLSILRDFIEQDKHVDADYEDCKGNPFPNGGELVEQLRYPDQTHAQELYDRWMGIYHDHKIPYRNGAELVGIETREDGLLHATYVAGEDEQPSVFCRTIILAIGRGSNPKIEIIGDPKGIRYKLRKPQDFVGEPACVIGGGMSAAEAVVAISSAKAVAEDPSGVFWCNRRQNLPKVAKGVALASKFFEAWTRGNIHHLPVSKPLAVVKGDDGEERLAVRVRRAERPDTPPELVCYEFEKKRVLACIGADRPDDFLGNLGIELFEAADSPKPKKLAVKSILESQVPNVFIAGSVLDPVYIEATDFSPEALQNTVKPHPGCFKTAVTDGVMVAEAINKVLSGEDALDISSSLEQLKDAFQPEPQPESSAEEPAAAQLETEVESSTEYGARFVHVVQKEQRGEYVFPPGHLTVGQTAGDLSFPSDKYLVNNHGALRIEPEACYATNESCDGTTYVKIDAERTVGVDTVLSVGRQMLRVERADGKLTLVQSNRDGVVQTLAVTDESKTYGRNDLAADDSYLSKTHFDVQAAGDMVRIRDASRNGTFVEVRGAVYLNEGDVVCMGDQRFRFEGMAGIAEAPGTADMQGEAEAQAPMDAGAATAVEAPPAPAGELAVVLQDGTQLPLDGDLPILSVLFQESRASDDEDEVEGNCQTLFECWDPDDPLTSGGKCGKCVVTVEQGAEQLGVASSKERNTIEKKSLKNYKRLDGAKCRLACKSIAMGGPVHIVQSGAPA